ncbi:hypothetical protein D3C76_1138410 [compost metagenome]
MGDGLLGGVASRQHHPYRARRLEFLDQRAEVVRTLGALGFQGSDRFAVAVMDHGTMPCTHQPSCDIAAHAAQPDDSQLHVLTLPLEMDDKAVQVFRLVQHFARGFSDERRDNDKQKSSQGRRKNSECAPRERLRLQMSLANCEVCNGYLDASYSRPDPLCLRTS